MATPPENKQDKELATLGFVTDKLRRGIVTGILGLLTIAIIALYQQNARLQRQLVDTKQQVVDMQGGLYEKMIDEMRRQVSPAIQQVNTAASKVDSAAVQVDSVARVLNQKK